MRKKKRETAAGPAAATPTATPTPGPAVKPLLVSIDGLAVMLDRSKASLERDDNAKPARIPKPIRIGGSVKWCVAEIEAWVAAGCPDRPTWECSAGYRQFWARRN